MKKMMFLFLLMAVGTLSWGQEDAGDFAKAKGWKKYKLTAHLTTGRTIEIKSRFNIDFCNKVMFLYDENDEIIYPQNTTFIERTLRNGSVIKGYPTDSLWLFPAFEGKISGYSTKPELKLKHVEYLVKGEGGMQDYSEEKLGSMLLDNLNAYDYYIMNKSKRKAAKIIYNVSFLVGLAHVYAPSPIRYNKTNSNGTVSRSDVPIYPELAFLGVLSGARLIWRAKKHLKTAVRIYNQ